MPRIGQMPLLYACAGTGLVLLWQALTVHYNYQDDWSALFQTSDYIAMPPAIAAEGTYRFRNAPGFDGQFYHFVAHDPFLRGDTARFVDNPRLRWRRILVPGLAWMLAAGQSDYIDSTYAVVVLAFVFLGVYWMSAWCVRCAAHPSWGLAFVTAPAVLVSIDCFTVDVALAALCCGLAVYGRVPSWRLFAILALAPLARETGLVLIAAYVLHCVWRRNWVGVLVGGAAAVPFLAWLAWLLAHTGPDSTQFLSLVPFRGLVERTMHPAQFALTSGWLKTAAILDYLAVWGIWAAVALAVWLVWRRRPDLLSIAAVLFAGFAVFVSDPQMWGQAGSFARTLSPLLIWLALIGIAERSWWNYLPWAMTAPRLIFQLSPQWHGVLHGIRVSAHAALR